MQIKRVVPNIHTDRIAESRKFYCDFLGFQVVMDLEWILTLASPSHQMAQISLVRNESSVQPNQDFSLTIEVEDVDAMHAKANENGLPIVYPLTTEPWGVRRFHVSDPNGVRVNIMNHVSQ